MSLCLSVKLNQTTSAADKITLCTTER